MSHPRLAELVPNVHIEFNDFWSCAKRVQNQRFIPNKN